MIKYVALDLETGGIETDKSLLEVYFAALDENKNVVDSLHLFVKPNNGVYFVTAKALEINGINLVEHDAKAITYAQASQKLYDWLDKINPKGESKLFPVGHNVAFDIEFVCAHLISKSTWQKFVSYRVVDTMTIGLALQDAGVLDPTIKGSLSSYIEFFKISHGTLHTAKEDTLATIEVWKKLIGLMRGADEAAKKEAS